MSDKNADGRAGQEHRTAPSQEGHAAGPACSAPEGEYVPLTAEQKSALNRAHLASVKVVAPAPDEALIVKLSMQIEDDVCRKWGHWFTDSMRCKFAIRWAIREYIRRSAGKEKG